MCRILKYIYFSNSYFIVLFLEIFNFDYNLQIRFCVCYFSDDSNLKKKFQIKTISWLKTAKALFMLKN